jgi:hypothetical protein
MGSFLRLIDNADAFAEVPNPIFVNDVGRASREKRAQLEKALTTEVTGVFTEMPPSCDCEQTTDYSNLGLICTNCNTPVIRSADRDLRSMVWIRRPGGVSKLMNPMFLNMLLKLFKKKNFNYIYYLLDSTYRPNCKTPNDVDELAAKGIKRGYNYFVDNLEFVITALFDMKTFRQKGRDRKSLMRLIKIKRDKILLEQLPLINKSLSVVEKTESDSYVDPTVIMMIDAIRTIQGIDTTERVLGNHAKQQRTAKTLIMLTEAYDEMRYGIILTKKGIVRKNLCGTRTAFSMRFVISSITWPHDYEGIEIPWAGALMMFFLHLVSKLAKRGMSNNECIRRIELARYKFDQELYDLLIEICGEFPVIWDEDDDEETKAKIGGRPWTTIGRFPTLKRGSIQAMPILKIKKDPYDQTIGISPLCIKEPNADFDGDQEVVVLQLDEVSMRAIRPMRAHLTLPSTNGHRQLGQAMSFTKPVVVTVNNWIEWEDLDEPLTQQQIHYLEGLS